MMTIAILFAATFMQQGAKANVDMLGSFGSGFTAPNVAGTSSIPTPNSGDIIFNTVDSTFYGSDGTSWSAFSSGSSSGTPAGTISAYAGDTAPSGWVMCDGSEIDQGAPNAGLYAVVGSRFGSATSGKFRVPDLRGQFLRGRDNGAGRDPNASTRTGMGSGGSGATGDAVGSVQGHAFQTHTHIQDAHNHGIVFGFANDGGGNIVRSGSGTQGTAYNNSVTATNQSAGATGTYSQASTAETRPTNVSVNYIIKL